MTKIQHKVKKLLSARPVTHCPLPEPKAAASPTVDAGEKKRLIVFSNVFYAPEHRIKTKASDILVFINNAKTAGYYANDDVERKLCIRRSMQKGFGSVTPFAENRALFKMDGTCNVLPKSILDAVNAAYDWNYEPRDGRAKCATTGFLAVKYLESIYPDREIVLVNFGLDVKNSTRRSTDHNWRYENDALMSFTHYNTPADERKRRILLRPLQWLGDNIYASAVIKNIAATGMFDINVQSGIPELWKNCPYLDKNVTEKNADYSLRLSGHTSWKRGCRHLIDADTRWFAGFIGEDVPTTYTRPELWLDLPPERLIAEPYVIINTGWNTSGECKRWKDAYWRELIAMRPDIHFVQTGKSGKHAVPFDGAESRIDKTGISDLARLVRDASCVISPPSGVIHFAAAFNTPYVMIAGGREPVTLTGYGYGEELSVIGKYCCCKKGGCRAKTFMEDADHRCVKAIDCGERLPVAQCMLDITPKMVSEALDKQLRIRTGATK